MRNIETKPFAIGIIILCTVFTSFGSLLLKVGMNRFVISWPGVLDAYPVLIGVFLYFFGFLLMVFAFKHGELSILFPFISLSFVWVTILSFLILSEVISVLEMVGVGVIVMGVVLIGLSSRNGKKSKLRLRA